MIDGPSQSIAVVYSAGMADATLIRTPTAARIPGGLLLLLSRP
jgi:hypothetical protein